MEAGVTMTLTQVQMGDPSLEDKRKDDFEEEKDDLQIANEEEAGTYVNSFKNHLEHELEDTDIAKLIQGKDKFVTKSAATGVQGGNWGFNDGFVPKALTIEMSCIRGD